MTEDFKSADKYKSRREALVVDWDESTGLSWLWCLLFGPLWFLYIGAGWWALGSLAFNVATLGIGALIAPFFAYRAHRYVAEKKVDRFMEATR